MSSLFNHIFIPLAILLLFSDRLKLDQRKVLALSFFAVLPDADAIFLPHRALFHNIFILIIPVLLFISLRSRRDLFGIICFYLASHLVLDLFNGGIFLFYPVYNKVFFARAELLFELDSFIPVTDYGIRRAIVNMGKGEPAISSENTGVALLLIVLIIVLVMRSKNKRK